VKRLFATRNRAAAELARNLARMAATDLPILIEGETGSGKSFVAQRLHRASRPDLPLVTVDCGAFPETLFVSELFGHVAGAFTDATRARPGAFARAGAGTLVLDRLDVLPTGAQVALLRVLEERRFTPLGTSSHRHARARVIALVDTGVDGAVSEGRLRADLYHRLGGFRARLLPLRQRPEDIVPFARKVMTRQAHRLGRELRMTSEVQEVLRRYPWPGNFRELEAVITRATMATESTTIGVRNLDLPAPPWATPNEPGGGPIAPLRDAMRAYALAVLSGEGGNVSRAARALGISRRTLIRWRQK